jgi:hypothetical protein
MKIINYKKLDGKPIPRAYRLLAILGLVDILAFVFMVIIFIFERLGFSPFFAIILIPSFTWGENFLMFMACFIVALWAAILIGEKIVLKIQSKNKGAKILSI